MKVYLVHHADALSIEQDPQRHISQKGRDHLFRAKRSTVSATYDVFGNAGHCLEKFDTAIIRAFPVGHVDAQLLSAGRFSERAISFADILRNTVGSRSSASLWRVTRGSINISIC